MPRPQLDLTGEPFGRLTVIGPDPDRRLHWLCRCNCPAQTVESRSRNSLVRSRRGGHQPMCRRCQSELNGAKAPADLTGWSAGRLTVIGPDPDGGGDTRTSYWLCRCSCPAGTVERRSRATLISGVTKGHEGMCRACLAGLKLGGRPPKRKGAT